MSTFPSLPFLEVAHAAEMRDGAFEAAGDHSMIMPPPIFLSSQTAALAHLMDGQDSPHHPEDVRIMMNSGGSGDNGQSYHPKPPPLPFVRGNPGVCP